MIKKKLLIGTLILLLIPICLSSALAAQSNTQPILIQGAMDLEIQTLVNILENPQEVTYAGWTFWQGTIEKQPVVISRTEIGMTNAAAATVLGIEKFNPLYIINQGTSGGHDPNLSQFDIILGKKAISTGMLKSNHRDKDQGIEPTACIPMTTQVLINGERKDFNAFEGSPQLIKSAQNVADLYTHGKVVLGTIGTDNKWNREIDQINWIHETFDTSAEEMETASASQVAKAYGVPFLGIRILSNSEPLNQEWDPKAGDYCQEFVLKVIKKIALEQTSVTKTTPEIYLNDDLIELKNTPLLVNNTYYLPVRELFTKLGGTVTWNSEMFAAQIKWPEREISIYPKKDGIIKEDTLYIPLSLLPQIPDYHLLIKGRQEIRFMEK